MSRIIFTFITDNGQFPNIVIGVNCLSIGFGMRILWWMPIYLQDHYCLL